MLNRLELGMVGAEHKTKVVRKIFMFSNKWADHKMILISRLHFISYYDFRKENN